MIFPDAVSRIMQKQEAQSRHPRNGADSAFP
jgi:hypothetical protein